MRVTAYGAQAAFACRTFTRESLAVAILIRHTDPAFTRESVRLVRLVTSSHAGFHA